MFEIVIGIDDFLIQLVKYCIYDLKRNEGYITLERVLKFNLISQLG